MAAQTILIRVQLQGAQQAAAGLGKIGGAARSAGTDLGFLQKSLLGISAGLGAREILRSADSYTSLGNRVRIFTKDAAETDQTVQALVDTAIEARVEIGTVAEVFQRFALVMGETGKTTQQLVGITNTLSKAVAVSGATAQEAEGALRQLSQGFSANRLAGQEFNSVIEQLPIIAVLIARELDTTTGSLRALSREGKITREVLDNAFTSGAKLIDVLFASTRITFAQAFTNLSTAVSVFIGRLNEAGSVGNGFVSVLQNFSFLLIRLSRDTVFLQNALKVLEAVLLGLATVVVAQVAGAFVKLLGAMVAVARFNVFGSLRNAAVGFSAALVAPIAGIILLRDQVIEIGDQKTTVGDLAAVFATDVVSSIEASIVSTFGLVDALKEVDEQTRILPKSFQDVVDDFGTGFRIILVKLEEFNKKRALLSKESTGASDAFLTGLGPAGAVLSRVQKAFAANQSDVQAEFKRITEESNRRTFEELNAPSVLKGSDLLKRGAERTSAREGREGEAAKIRAEAEKARAEALAVLRGEGDAKNAVEELSKAQVKALDSFRDLRSELSPLTALLNKYEDNVNTIIAAEKTGKVTADQVTEAYKLLNEQFAEAVTLVPKESQQITDLREALADLRNELDPASAIAEEYAKRLELISRAAQSIPGVAGQVGELTRQATEAFNEGNAELKRQDEQKRLEATTGIGAVGAGAKLAGQELVDELGTQSLIIADGFVNAFQIAGDAFSEFVSKGKVDIRSLGQAIIDTAIQAITQLLVLKAIEAGLSAFGGGTGGGFGNVAGGASSTAGLLGRATGGPVNPAGSFLVGERGPELFTPPETGRVVPNNQLGGSPTVNVQVVNVDDPSTVPKAMSTKSGEQVIMNTIQRNRGKLREVLT